MVCELPSTTTIDYDYTLRNYLSKYVNELKLAVGKYPDWNRKRIETHMESFPLQKSGALSLKRFRRGANGNFNAIIEVLEMPSDGRLTLQVDQDTSLNAIGECLRAGGHGNPELWQRQALKVEELSKEEIDAICRAEPPAKAAEYNDE